MITLYQHQQEGKEFLLKKKKAALFFEVGTGKTFTALSAVCDLPPGRLLIVAPKRVLENVWLKDTNYNLTKHEVTYLNYEKIARDPNFTKCYWDYVILDEVHKLKGKTTKTSRKFRTINNRAEYVFGLTGTPVANSYVDVYNIYKNMGVPEFDDLSYDDFLHKYYWTKEMSTQFGFHFEIPLAPKQQLINELMERVGHYAVVKRAKECVDLPDQRTELVYIPGMKTKQYCEIQNGILNTENYSKTMIKLEALNKAHQAANGFYYDDWGNAVDFTNNNKLTELNEILVDMLEETERVIIVYYYQHDLEQLKTLKYDWTTEVDDFPNKQILFLQYSQAEGLNLQYCNHMIFYTYDYSFLKYEQMCGRIYRNGQKNNVTYTILIAEKTIEEKIWWAIKNKKTRDEYLKEVLSDD